MSRRAFQWLGVVLAMAFAAAPADRAHLGPMTRRASRRANCAGWKKAR